MNQLDPGSGSGIKWGKIHKQIPSTSVSTHAGSFLKKNSPQNIQVKAKIQAGALIGYGDAVMSALFSEVGPHPEWSLFLSSGVKSVWHGSSNISVLYLIIFKLEGKKKHLL